MRLRKFNAYGVPWTIEYVIDHPELKNDENLSEEEDSWEYDHGIIIPDDDRILINAKLSPERKHLTEVHENLHLICFENNLNLTEGQVKSLASGLVLLYEMKLREV